MRLLWRLSHRLPVGRCVSIGTLRENERLLLGGFCASSLHCRECNMRPIMKALRGTLPLLSGLYQAHSITNAVRADAPTGLSVTPSCVVWKMPSIAFSTVLFFLPHDKAQHLSLHLWKRRCSAPRYENGIPLLCCEREHHCLSPGLVGSLKQTVAVYYQGKCDSKGDPFNYRLFKELLHYKEEGTHLKNFL